ncbi:MAG: clan AA aspartic protease [Flavobacteriales bacterium]|nr:clan AA aspartic protease [Flavobacteriales bacterium]
MFSRIDLLSVMKMAYHLLLILGILGTFLSACTSLKNQSSFNNGGISTKNFHENISVEKGIGYMIVPVKIKDKPYRFLFNPGSLTAISTALDTILKLPSARNVNLKHVEGIDKKQTMVRLDSLTLGNVSFKNINAIVVNFKVQNATRCLQLDGVLGANALKNCKWKVNYSKGYIEFSDNINNLTDSNLLTIPFHQGITGIPIVDVNIGGQQVAGFTLDMNYQGEVSMNENDVPKTLDSAWASMVKSIAMGSSTIIDTSTWFLTKAQFDESNNMEVMVKASNNYTNRVGIKLLKNYEFVMDWSSGKMGFSEPNQENRMDRLHLEMGPAYINQEIIIGEIVLNSMSWMHGLRLGNVIKKFGMVSYENPTEKEYCEILGLFQKLPGSYVVETDHNDPFIGNSLLLNELKIE